MSVINPYSGVNWATDQRMLGVSHQHLAHSMTGFTPQSAYDEIYATGVRVFAVSRYRPSLVSYPFDYTDNTFTYVANPFDTDVPISQLKEDYGFEVSIAPDVVGLPNAEHIYPWLYVNGKRTRWSNVHINAIGSTYESGTVPPEGGVYRNAGLDMDYTDAYDNMLDNLLYDDGGGIIINHPMWTTDNTHVQLDIERFIRDSLDYDSRVLGTDLLTGGKQLSMEFDERVIDNILSTGRRCWIFGQGDWARDRGRNVLLVPSGVTDRSELEHECLKAYRNGRFYSRYADSDLDLTDVSYADGEFHVSAANADAIKVIIDGRATTYQSDDVTVQVPGAATYVRAVAYVERDEDPDWNYKDGDVYKDVIFTNPVMVNPVEWPYDPAYDVPEQDVVKRRFDMMLWG